MAETPKLKDFFDAARVRELGASLALGCRDFDQRAFVSRGVSGLDELELTGRAMHLADVMHHFLPQPFPEAARALTASLGPPLESSDSFGLAPFRYMPHVFYVQKYGLDHFEPAMALQYELTQRFSAESSIRAYLVRYPRETYERLLAWSEDPNVHVRRLVSEGTRPRLPWAPRLRAFQLDPEPVLALLERLKDDPERYVQRSVANNLNDIGKDHPDRVVEVCREWTNAPSPARRWIVGHALRSLVKKGHRGALSLLGVGARPKVAVSAVRFQPKVARIGGEVRFSFSLESGARTAQELAIDYAVYFVKANGAPSPKVFKLKRLSLAPGSSVDLRARVSFAPMTTRRHYPGSHRVALLINGIAHELGAFEVR